MNIENIEHFLNTHEIVVHRIEHHLSDNQLIITYRAPSNTAYLCSPQIPVPDKFYRVVYGIDGSNLRALNIQVGTEKITPETREIIYQD